MPSTYAWDDTELRRLELQAGFSWKLIEPALDAVGVQAGHTVVDLGCGPGRLTAQLAARVGVDGRAIGVDIDGDLLHRAAQVPVPEGAPPVHWLRADARDLPLDDGSADCVIVHMLLQHLPDPHRAVAEARRVLAPGGHLVIVDADDALLWLHPPPEGFLELEAGARAHQAALGGDREIGRKLHGLLAAQGFDELDVGVRVFPCPPWPIALLFQAAIGFKPALFPPDERAAAQQRAQAIHDVLDAGETSGQIGLYVVRGRRP